jgi:hypothetical protein
VEKAGHCHGDDIMANSKKLRELNFVTFALMADVLFLVVVLMASSNHLVNFVAALDVILRGGEGLQPTRDPTYQHKDAPFGGF